MKRLDVSAASLAARARSLCHTAGELPEVIVFSRDRAPQLEMLLDSYARQVEDTPEATVLYSTSSRAHRAAYDAVFANSAYGFARPIAEESFRADLLRVLHASRRRAVMFLVDDLVFIRPVSRFLLSNFHPALTLVSLRLGRCIRRDFTANGASCDLPRGHMRLSRGGERLLRWRWRSGSLSWGLPTSLDATLLPRMEILPIIEAGTFRAPNSLELDLGHYRALFKTRYGLCPEEPSVVNLPLNSVKSEDYYFPCLDISPEDLLQSFNAGQRLRLEVDLAEHDSVHMPWVPSLKPAAHPVGSVDHRAVASAMR